MSINIFISYFVLFYLTHQVSAPAETFKKSQKPSDKIRYVAGISDKHCEKSACNHTDLYSQL